MNNKLSGRRGNRRRTQAVLMILGSLLMLASMSAGAYFNRGPALNETTLCPRDQPLANSMVILVDATDALTRTQAARLLATVREARDSIPTFGKLTLLFLDADTPYEPKELVSLCNPGSPRGVNPLFRTESRVAKRWVESFGAPTDKAVAKLLSSPTAKRSPIIEAITAATWRPDFDGRTMSRRLIVVSDMLQNTPGEYTHYANRDLWWSFQRSRLYSEADANLNGVDVEIDYLRRPAASSSQGEAHRAYWRRWFRSHGARTLRFIGMIDSEERGGGETNDPH